MDKDFLIEEYKAMQAGIAKHQAAYFALENYTFGGMLVVYGIFFGIAPATDKPPHVPLTAWWVIFLLVLIAFVRCLGHYLIVRKLASYILRIEDVFYADEPALGFERMHLTTGIVRPWMNLAVNIGCWLILLAISGGLAVEALHGVSVP